MKYIIIYGILLGGVLCGGTNAVGAVRDSGKKKEKVEAYSSVWLSQIHKALNGQGVVGVNGQTLRLKSYRYRGKLDSKAQDERLMADLFGEETMLAMYVGTEVNDFILLPLKDACDFWRKNQIANPLNSIKEDWEAEFTLLPYMAMDVIDLEWEYGGKVVRSVALASETKGILYDPIGSRVVRCVDKVDRKLAWKPDSDISLQSQLAGAKESLEEYTSIQVNANLPADSLLSKGTVVTTRKIASYKNFWGETLYGYNLICQSVFDAAGALIGWETLARSVDHAGYSCEADIRTVKTGEKYHEFAWAYACREGPGASVEWDGHSYDVSGQMDANGVNVHRIEEY